MATGQSDHIAIRRSNWRMPLVLAVLFALSWVLPRFEIISPYLQLLLVSVGVNIILTTSLNLVNGYMGEFSVGHAGFMAVGAYGAAIMTVSVLPYGDAAQWLFPLAIIAGGLAAALLGCAIAFLSFKTRGDYLAIVTLAFLMIVKSTLENVDAVGGARGFLGIERLTTLPWVVAWSAVTVWAIRNLVHSRYGRDIQAVRDDEIAANQTGVDTQRAKVLAFSISSFFAGVAGGLYAHHLQFINPRMFDIVKSTDMLVMVYLGGIGSLGGSILGATIYTLLLELLRPFGAFRMMLMPLMLVLLMLFRPRGIMGMREFSWLVPSLDRPRTRGRAATVDVA
ncbi:MAG TPA: branched-chain amino acid ABC transporter permease [Candidatus Limnocylindrales bacterium]|nr:branched-chain amino acid ABC transporter permease [Candidatus Limnocylindrales bacterium]